MKKTRAIWAMVAIYILQLLPDDPVTPTPLTTKGTIRPRPTLARPKEDQLSYKVFKLKQNKGKHKQNGIQKGKKHKRNAFELQQLVRTSAIQQPKVVLVKQVSVLDRNKILEIKIEKTSTSTMKSTVKVLHMKPFSNSQKNMNEKKIQYKDKNSTNSKIKVGLKIKLMSKKSILPKVPLSEAALMSNYQAKSTSKTTVKNTRKLKSRMEKQVFKVTHSNKKYSETDMALTKYKWLSYIRNIKKYTTDKAIYLTTQNVMQSKKLINNKNVDSTAAHQTKRSIFDNLNTLRVNHLSENINIHNKRPEKNQFDVHNVTENVLILDLWTHPSSVSRKQTTESRITTETQHMRTASTKNTLYNKTKIVCTLEHSTKKSAMTQKLPMRLVLKIIARGKPMPMYSNKVRKLSLEYKKNSILKLKSKMFMRNKVYPTKKERILFYR